MFTILPYCVCMLELLAKAFCTSGSYPIQCISYFASFVLALAVIINYVMYQILNQSKHVVILRELLIPNVRQARSLQKLF